MTLLTLVLALSICQQSSGIRIFREEDFYSIRTVIDLHPHFQALGIINMTIITATNKYRQHGAEMVFDDLNVRIKDILSDLLEISDHTFNPIEYIKERTKPSDIQFDPLTYIRETGKEKDHYFSEFRYGASASNNDFNAMEAALGSFEKPKNRMANGRRKRSADSLIGVSRNAKVKNRKILRRKRGAFLKRVKRGLADFIGSAIHTVTGLPGPHEYQMLARESEKEKIALLKGANLTKEAQDDIRMTTNKLEKTEFRVDKLENELSTINRGSYSVIDYIKKCTELSYFRDRMLSSLNVLQREIFKLKLGLETARRGYLSREIIPFKKLAVIINEINSNTRKLTVVFPQNRLSLVYEMRNTKIDVTDKIITFFTRIPLVDISHTADLIPIDASIKMQIGYRADFIVQTRTRKAFQTITMNDLGKSLFFRDFGYIISKRHVDIYPNLSETPQNFSISNWVIEEYSDHFLIMHTSQFEAEIICGRKSNKVNMPQFAQIFLPEHCEIHADWFTILKYAIKGLETIHPMTAPTVTDLWQRMEKIEDERQQSEDMNREKISIYQENPITLKLKASKYNNEEKKRDYSNLKTELRTEFGILLGILIVALVAATLLALYRKKHNSQTASFFEENEMKIQVNNQIASNSEEIEALKELYEKIMTNALKELKNEINASNGKIDELNANIEALQQSNINTENYEGLNLKFQTKTKHIENEIAKISKKIDESIKSLEQHKSEQKKLMNQLETSTENNIRSVNKELEKIENIRLGLQ